MNRIAIQPLPQQSRSKMPLMLKVGDAGMNEGLKEMHPSSYNRGEVLIAYVTSR